MIRRLLILLLLLLAATTVRADQKASITFEDQIKPIFRQHCWKCHGEDEQKADINLAAFGSDLKGR